MVLYEKETMRFLAVSDAAIVHRGYTVAQFLEMAILDIGLPEERGEFRRIVRRLPLGWSRRVPPLGQ
jgi:hypothetical protein